MDDGVGNNPVASTLETEHPRRATYTVTQNAAPACVLRGGLRKLIPGIISASRVGVEPGLDALDDVTGFVEYQLRQLCMSEATPTISPLLRAIRRPHRLLHTRTSPFRLQVHYLPKGNVLTFHSRARTGPVVAGAQVLWLLNCRREIPPLLSWI